MNNHFNISDDIASAETLSSDFYTDKKIFESSKEVIFSNSWQLIVNTINLQKNNQYPFIFLKNYLNEPLVLTQKKGLINCYSNVCTHRAHLVCLDHCNRSVLRCPYHGRTFELNGKMKAMPGFDDVKNFPTEKDDLPIIPTLFWRDFIFVSLNQGINIQPVLDDIDLRLQGYEFEKLVLDENQSDSYTIDSHWALYCENYLEGFHIPFVHKGLDQNISSSDYETILLENAVLQTATCADPKDTIQLDVNAPDADKKMYAYYYWIFPNLMLNFYAWGLSVNIVEPVTTGRTRIRYLIYTFPHIDIPTTNGTDVVTVELEDQSVVKSVQKGIKSRYYKKGRYSPTHEKGVHHFHGLLADSLNSSI